MGWLVRRRRPHKGAVLVEFALSALLLVVVLLGTIEFGLQIYARSTTDRLANRMGEAYASTRDSRVAAEVAENAADSITRLCLQEPRFVVFDEVATLDPLRAEGRPAPVGLAGVDAVAFRVEVVCKWPQLTPGLGALLGGKDGYGARVFGRFRMEGEP